jgi:hypothetical protein
VYDTELTAYRIFPVPTARIFFYDITAGAR